MTTDSSSNWDQIVDVVVVGSGGGITGAYTAAREGLSVALVEGSDKFGGTTAFSGGGGMWFPCNPVLRRAGVDDTIEDALTYFHAVVGDRTPRELQDAYVRGGARLIDYLEAGRCVRVQGAAVARLLRRRAGSPPRRDAPHRLQGTARGRPRTATPTGCADPSTTNGSESPHRNCSPGVAP